MKFYNSLSKTQEEFRELKPRNVSIYVCGITPYDTTHLGHAFTYIFFDALIRYLEFKKYKVSYTQNVTDINDRDNDILKRAKEQNIPWQDLSQFWTKRFLDDMKTLNWRKPDNYLYASKEIEKIVIIIKKLLGNKIAYKVKGNVYLDISKDNSYGELSKLSREEMLKIAKDYDEDIENPNKKNPLDITLWRSSSLSQPAHIPSFQSPFGKGRPGWHIECSAMAISSLGERIDIHGGGKDLIFPHHEAEIIQSQNATGKKPFSKFFLHTGIISYEGKKMSKSLGNLVLVADLLKKYSANSIRFFLLSHKYRNNWEFKFSDLDKSNIMFLDIEKALNKNLGSDRSMHDYLKEFEEIMDLDLDTVNALDLIHEISERINSGQENSVEVQSTLKAILETLGFRL
jgi:L-cysteine:1D-myo-inositol 2-amino-2-deoxy-alpha-D-glucopyranoside ligase